MRKEMKNASNHKKILWLTLPAYAYISENAESTLIDIRSVYKKKLEFNSKLKTLICILFSYIKLDWFLFGSWKKEVDKYDAIVIRDGMPNYLVKAIHERWSDKKIIVYFVNIIRDPAQKEYLNFSKSITDLIFTFDEEDSKYYSIHYASIPFTYEISNSKNQIASVYFFGRDKGRKTQINEIKNLLEQQGISTDFTIVESKSQFRTYQEIFEKTSQSRAILEITEERQQSFSIRIVEALFLQKKIITNKLDMRDADFYQPNNIFIIGLDDVNEIKEWYNKPYQRIPDEILYRYSLDYFGYQILKVLY